MLFKKHTAGVNRRFVIMVLPRQDDYAPSAPLLSSADDQR